MSSSFLTISAWWRGWAPTSFDMPDIGMRMPIDHMPRHSTQLPISMDPCAACIMVPLNPYPSLYFHRLWMSLWGWARWRRSVNCRWRGRVWVRMYCAAADEQCDARNHYLSHWLSPLHHKVRKNLRRCLLADQIFG